VDRCAKLNARNILETVWYSTFGHSFATTIGTSSVFSEISVYDVNVMTLLLTQKALRFHIHSHLDQT
jgi:hypothetical protein